MGFKYTMNNGNPEMSFDPDATAATDLLFSALVRQGSFFLNPGFGLRELPKKGNAPLVADCFKESAKWLLDTGKLTSLEVIAERDEDDPARINVLEKAKQANDTPVTFETFVGVI